MIVTKFFITSPLLTLYYSWCTLAWRCSEVYRKLMFTLLPTLARFRDKMTNLSEVTLVVKFFLYFSLIQVVFSIFRIYVVRWPLIKIQISNSFDIKDHINETQSTKSSLKGWKWDEHKLQLSNVYLFAHFLTWKFKGSVSPFLVLVLKFHGCAQNCSF